MSTTKKKTTSKKRYSKKTPEQREAEVKALRERQETAILNLVDSQQWTNYLDSLRHFRNYSAHNTLLILAQLPEATRVAGFNTWKALGRKVTSGAGSSLKIWGKPYRPKIWVDKGTEGDARVLEEEDGKVKIEAQFSRCPIVSVFDVSQTEGDPLPEVVTTLSEPEKTPEYLHLIETLTRWLTSQGWTVHYERIASGAKGTTSHELKRIQLNEINTTAQNAKTLIHEAAHAILHGDDTYAVMSLYERQNHRGVAEVQAESVAYVVAGILGHDTSQYSTGYVAQWAAQAARSMEREELVKVLQSSATAVKKGVDAILDGMEVESLLHQAEAEFQDQA